MTEENETQEPQGDQPFDRPYEPLPETIPVEETPIIPELPETIEEESANDAEPEQTEEEPEEEKVEQPRHQNIFAKPAYLGGEEVNPDNPLITHAGQEFETNKNRENR